MNLLIYTLVVLILIVVQASFLNILLPLPMRPDLLAIFIIYMSVTRRFKRTLFTAIACSYLLSLHSSSGFYLTAVSFVILFAVSRYITLNLYTGKLQYFLLSIFLPTFLSKLFLVVWHWFSLPVFLVHFYTSIFQSLLTAIVAIALFKLFYYIDIKTKVVQHELVRGV